MCTASFSEDTLKKEKQAAYTTDSKLILDTNGKTTSDLCPPCLQPIHISFMYLSPETSLLHRWSLDQQQRHHLGACYRRPGLLSQRLRFNRLPVDSCTYNIETKAFPRRVNPTMVFFSHLTHPPLIFRANRKMLCKALASFIFFFSNTWILS